MVPSKFKEKLAVFSANFTEFQNNLSAKVNRILVKSLETELSTYTGLFIAIIFFILSNNFTFTNFTKCLGLGIFGYLVYIRVEETLLHYAKNRRSKR